MLPGSTGSPGHVLKAGPLANHTMKLPCGVWGNEVRLARRKSWAKVLKAAMCGDASNSALTSSMGREHSAGRGWEGPSRAADAWVILRNSGSARLLTYSSNRKDSTSGQTLVGSGLISFFMYKLLWLCLDYEAAGRSKCWSYRRPFRWAFSVVSIISISPANEWIV
jgi:hypothetical protein